MVALSGSDLDLSAAANYFVVAATLTPALNMKDWIDEGLSSNTGIGRFQALATVGSNLKVCGWAD